jgi:large conductance mechanosensitive channel
MGLIKEFKEFISRGNVLDMAVGIIVGGAFTSIVTALVDNIITPIIGMISGGVDFSSLSVTVGSANLQYGAFIQAVINFLLVAFVLFMVLKAVNTATSKAQALIKKEEEEKAEAPAEPSEEVKLLTEIRDALTKK